MAETLVIVLEDVLLQGDRALDRHVTLYQGLATKFRSVVLSTATDRAAVQNVMRLNRLTYDILMTKDASVLTDVSWKVSAVRECLGVGWQIGLFLDTDPDAVREVYGMGVTSLLLTHHLLRPSWLPSNGPPRAWNDLVEFQEAQRERSAVVGSGRDRGALEER